MTNTTSVSKEQSLYCKYEVFDSQNSGMQPKTPFISIQEHPRLISYHPPPELSDNHIPNTHSIIFPVGIQHQN